MKRQIRVGLTVDGVLRNFGSEFIRYARQRKARIRDSDLTSWGFRNVTDPDGRQIIRDVFANSQIGKLIFENAPAYGNAFTGYQLMNAHPGIAVYVINNQKADYVEFTDTWLEKNEFTDHIKTFYERNKLAAPVQVLIDHKPEDVLKFVQNGRDAILIKQSYNQTNLPQSISVVNDLIDAYRILLHKYSRFL